MARQLTAEESPPARPRHDWAKWAAAGGTWVLTRGEDFDADPYGVARAAREWAARNDKPAAVRVKGSQVFVTWLTEEE